MTGFVLAISGPPGAGKTTLLGELMRRWPEATAIEMDRYEQATYRAPAEIADWLARGADYDALPLGALAADLAALKAGDRPVVFDTLLGRAHRDSGRQIDRLVWIDLPLDLALTRKLGAMASSVRNAPRHETERFLGWLDDYLDHYAGFIHDSYVLQQERVRPGADLIVDGRMPSAQQADAILGWLLSNPGSGVVR